MRRQPIGALAGVQRVTEHDDLPAGNERAADAAQQLLGLAREHRAAHDLDPPDRAHTREHGTSASVAEAPIGRFIASGDAKDDDLAGVVPDRVDDPQVANPQTPPRRPGQRRRPRRPRLDAQREDWTA